MRLFSRRADLARGRRLLSFALVVIAASTAGAFYAGGRDTRGSGGSWSSRTGGGRDTTSGTRNGMSTQPRRSSNQPTASRQQTFRTSRQPTRKATADPQRRPRRRVNNVAMAGFGGTLAGVTPEEQADFDEGQAAFETEDEAADGLGPVFNDVSCAACHHVGGTGGGSTTLETRFGTTTNGVFDPMTAFGGSLIQVNGIGLAGACNFVGEVVPPTATTVAMRRTTPLFGLGLVDAVPDETFIALAEKEARKPATAGRLNMVLDVNTGATRVGKFGWKAQVPNLLQFSGDAYLNEMGITTPMFPDENCPQGNCLLLDACDPVPGVDEPDLDDVEEFLAFMTFLAEPPQVPSPSRTFTAIGCANCHTTQLTTGPSDVAALDLKTFRPYSDFLLHDMGSLGDGIEQGQATGRDMRTAPLWGLRLLTTFLHDGRATSIEEAILAHDGQARKARDRFAALGKDSKAKLLAFLKTL
jgi:CxxC motif-containing protein (DUF1111 family)